ncbi:MAG: ggt [Bacteroidetes bacterium]|nr:ggt [Bacteroidota bacterium]
MVRALFLLTFAFVLFVTLAPSASKKPVRAKNGMVVSADSLATAAGVEILRNGGNAIDAAVAVGFALAVTYPEAGNIGGGGFMLIRLANGDATMVDFREKAPGKASRTMYLDSTGAPVTEKSLTGPLAAGVPGTVAGLLYALENFGTRSRKEVMAHAIEAAEQGMTVDRRMAASLAESHPLFARFSSSQKIFSRGGEPLKEGDILRQQDLATTLRAVSDKGKAGFYDGHVASLIVAEMEKGGGIMSRQDLLEYEAIEREPLFGSYRGYDILSSSPPSAGGVVLLEMLNILERFDLTPKGHGSSQVIHLLAAAGQRAYADRAKYLGDPDFTRIPIQGLISKQYAASRSLMIDSLHATSSAKIDAGVVSDFGEEHETTHYCVADRYGNVVSTTVTLNSLHGCKVVVDGAGFLLNNEMDDFVVQPGVPNQFGLVGGEANGIAPGKKMLSSMTPTIVMRDDQPYLLLGARGGGRITTAVAQIIVNVIDFGMNIQEAVDAPRTHHQWLPDTVLYEPYGLVPDVMSNLRRMGYAFGPTLEFNGRAEAMMIKDGYFYGAPDPREEGVALGY